jgi:hypothetical protein
MEARAEREGLRSGALSTVEAMVVSMGFMAPSVAMFFNTPFIAQFAGAAMPLAMLFSFAASGDAKTATPRKEGIRSSSGEEA